MGYEWRTAEHAYQAMKYQNEDFWGEMAYGDLTPGQAKKLGSKVPLPDWWADNKLLIMRNIVTKKFNQNGNLMDKLAQTKGSLIVEGNSWGDTFWGQCPVGKGRNELGKILMSIRDDITRFI